MPKRTMFTNITALPPSVSREVAIAMLHNHDEMIQLNPLVIEHHPIKTPRDAPADEFLDCVWQELTDKIHYLPGGLVKGKVSYKACFHDTPTGLQTHIYAPMGLDIREKWSIGGSLPGEPPEPRELGVNTPRTGLYLREDGDMRCNIMLTGFVRKNLDNSHKVLVERILKKAERIEEHLRALSPTTTRTNTSTIGSTTFQRGSHMAQSQFITSPTVDNPQTPLVSPMASQFGDTSIHPAFRNDRISTISEMSGSSHRISTYTPPAYHSPNLQQNGFAQDTKQDSYHQSQQPQHQQQQQFYFPTSPPPQQYQNHVRSPPAKEFIAELPGSTPDYQSTTRHRSVREGSSISEISNSEAPQRLSAGPYSHMNVSDRGSVGSEPSFASPPRHPYNSSPNTRSGSDVRNEQYVELPTPTMQRPTYN